MKTLKILSALLMYPTADLLAAAPEFRLWLKKESLIPAPQLAALEKLIDDLSSRDLYDAQERYILLFDRTRSLSLHLFEHVHGESRDRGQAMVDLLKVYEDGGFVPVDKELPDFIPMFLEFTAKLPPVEAIELVSQPGHVFAALRERLAKRHSLYEAVFWALASLAGSQLDKAALERLRDEPDADPNDLQALDAAWEEEEVIFGPGAAVADACGRDGLGAKLRQASRPAPGLAVPLAERPRPIIEAPVSART